MAIEMITDSDHYAKVLSKVTSVKMSLWIGTADIKDLHVKSGTRSDIVGFLVKKRYAIITLNALVMKLVNDRSLERCLLFPNTHSITVVGRKIHILSSIFGPLSARHLFQIRCSCGRGLPANMPCHRATSHSRHHCGLPAVRCHV